MRTKQSTPQAVKKSHWHSFLYFASAFIGMSCGRCVAELVMVATNYASDSQYFNEEDRVTQGWMLIVAGSLGLVAGLAFTHSHRQAHEIHAGNVLLNGLKAGKLKFTESDTYDFRDNESVYDEVLPLAKECASQFDLVSGGFDKQPVLDRLRVFKRDLQAAYQASKDEDVESRGHSLSNALVSGLIRLSSDLQQVINDSFDAAPLIKPSLGRRLVRHLCCLGISASNSLPQAAVATSLTDPLITRGAMRAQMSAGRCVELSETWKGSSYQPLGGVSGQGVAGGVNESVMGSSASVG